MFLLLLVVLYLLYMCKYYNTFRRQGIPVHSTPLPCLGTMYPIMKDGMYKAYEGLLDKYGDTFGAYNARLPCLVTIDFDILRDVFVKDTETFASRNRLTTGDPLHENMINNISDYKKWKHIRSLMSPTFSSGKLKRMMPRLNKCAQQMLSHLEQPAKDGKSIEMKDTVGCFTMDVIANTAFGIDLDSHKDENNDFVRYAKMAFEVDFSHPIFIIFFFCPFLLRFLPYFKVKVMKKEMTDFFTGVTKQMMERRQDDKGEDFLSLMMNAHNEVEGDGSTRKLSEPELIANSLMFFLAGYDTTATTISFLAHCLMANPEVQDRLVEEIEREIQDRETITDEDLQNMPYLEMCINETLRMYPPAALTERQSNQPVVLKGGIHLPAYSFVRVPILEMHYHAKIYPQPEKFDPQR